MRRLILIIPLALTLFSMTERVAFPAQSGFMIHGIVSLPNGRPASRVTVKINGFNGLDRQTTSDDQGRYEFFGIPGGRYRITAINPQDPTQYSDPTEADTSRVSGSNRLVVHLSMRATSVKKESHKPAVLSVAEASQRIPKDALKEYEKGLRYKEEKKLSSAVKSFDRALELYPEYFQALTARGEVRIIEGKITEAFADLNQALKLNEDYQPALRGAGFCLLGRQMYPEAARYLVRALDLDGADASAHLYLGITLIGLNQHALAEQAFLQALKHGAEATVSAHMYLADIYSRNREYELAARELQSYLKARPDAPNAAKLRSMEAEFRSRAASSKKQ